MSKSSALARAIALAACASLGLAPLAAEAAVAKKPKRSVPIAIQLSYGPANGSVWSVSDETVHKHRWRRYRHHDRIDGGDVLAGILVLGGIAAIASAASKGSKSRRERDDDRYRDQPYDYRGSDERQRDYGRSDRPDGYSPGEADRAVDACVAEASRDGRIDEVFDVGKRDGEWHVTGDYADGRRFACSVDRNGRARLGAGDHAASAEPAEGDEDRFAAAQAPDFEELGTR